MVITGDTCESRTGSKADADEVPSRAPAAPDRGLRAGDERSGRATNPNPGTLDAVLFDLGDTLIHFETSSPTVLLNTTCRAGHARLTELGLNPPPISAYLRALTLGFFKAWLASRLSRREMNIINPLAKFHARKGVEISEAQFLEVIKSTLIPAMKRHTTVDPEAKELLDRLRDDGVKMGLVSNTPFPDVAIDAYLETAGLLDYFPVRVYSSDVGFMKPHPRIFEIALERMGVEAGRSLYVGDRVDKDIRGASRAGMETVLFVHDTTTFRGRATPDHRIHALSDLVEIVRQRIA